MLRVTHIITAVWQFFLKLILKNSPIFRESRDEEMLRQRSKNIDYDEGITLGGRLEQGSTVSPLQVYQLLGQYSLPSPGILVTRAVQSPLSRYTSYQGSSLPSPGTLVTRAVQSPLSRYTSYQGSSVSPLQVYQLLGQYSLSSPSTLGLDSRVVHQYSLLSKIIVIKNIFRYLRL